MKKKILMIILILILIYAVGGICFNYFFKEEKEVIKTLSVIEGYNYELRSNATDLEKREFTILKENLESDTIDENAYLESISKLFIINLYTLKNKINKYDISSTDYIFPSYVSTFKLKVENTIYKYLEDNTSLTRDNELPEVQSVIIEQIKNDSYEFNDQTYESFLVILSWNYVKDMEYDNEGILTIIKDDNTLYIVEKNELKKSN